MNSLERNTTASPLLNMLMNSTLSSQISTTTNGPETDTDASIHTTTASSSVDVSTISTTIASTLFEKSTKYIPNNIYQIEDEYQFQIPDLRQLPLSMIILLLIAIIFVLWVLIKFFQAIWTYFICYRLGFGAKWCPGPDSWAIITGATDGIGLAYAKAMAKKGYCLLLISRNPQKLDKVKADILNEFPDCPRIKTMAVDYTLDTIYPQIAEEIRSLNGHVHVLINNVGMTYKYPEYFTKILNSDKFISDILNCNVLSVTRMTHIVLPLMEARKSGIIINVSSFSALFPTPLLAIYSASKIYMDFFSRALHAEYCDRGIIVQSVVPYYVSTNMIRNPAISFMIPTADKFVDSALKTVGVQTRTYGYFAHNMLAFFQNFIVKFIIGNNLNTKLAYRKMRRFRKGCYQRKGLDYKV